MRQVVGEGLVGVDAAALGELTESRIDDRLGRGDEIVRVVEVEGGRWHR